MKPKTSKTPKKQTVLLRKKLSATPPDDLHTHLKIIGDYLDGISVADLELKYRLKQKTIHDIVSNHWSKLTNIRETRLLSNPIIQGSHSNHKSHAYHALKGIQRASSMNEKFLDELSDDLSPLLTDMETQWALLYASTGNAKKALLSSGLDVGLIRHRKTPKGGSSALDGWNMSILLRSEYLKSKPNVAKYLQILKTEKYLPDAIDKSYIQRELLEQLAMTKEDDTLRPDVQKKLMLETTRDLGRTIGAFSDRITVDSVDPAEALDLLAQLNSANLKASNGPVLELTPESVSV